MKILIISCVFTPEPVTSAITSEQLAQALSNKGYDVSVIVPFPNRPGGKLYDGYQQRWRQVEKHPTGYTIVRVYSIFSQKSTLLSRLVENFSFGITSTIESLRLSPDVVYVNTWPLFALGITTLVCSLRKLPALVNIQDIYPEALVGLDKVSSEGIATTLLKKVDNFIVSKSHKVVVPSENFADFYRNTRDIAKEKIYTVYNWLNETEIKPSPRIGTFRAMLDIDDNIFVVMYAGNIGAVAGVDLIIEIAKELQNNKSILFVIAGSGTCKEECEELIAKYQLSNVTIFSPLPQELFCEVQGAADLMILPTRTSGALTSVPSKLIAYMLASRPVLACVAEESDTAKIIERAECGIVITHRDASRIADEIQALSYKINELEIMGCNGYDYAIKNFSSRACLPKLVKIIEEVSEDTP